MKVSVQMITYNHKKYIAQAIEGVLMQETDFPYELVIGEDCSTDGTRDIVVDYARRHPDKIRLLLPEQNLGMHENARRTREACQGEYRAVCEGDDYWTDPHKLQKQVDFLEAHPECSMCFHSAEVLYEDGSRATKPSNSSERKPLLSLEDILAGNPVPTCSVMLRNHLTGELPAWFYGLMMGDWPLWVLLAQHGKLGYLNTVMGVYRIHRGGIWSGGDYLAQLHGWFTAYDAVDRHLGYRYHDLIEQVKVTYLLTAADEFVSPDGTQIPPGQRAQMMTDFVEAQLGHDPYMIRRFKQRYWSRSFFEAAQEQNYSGVRHSLQGLLRHSPSLFTNRGVWSIIARAFVGEDLATALGQIVRRAGF